MKTTYTVLLLLLFSAFATSCKKSVTNEFITISSSKIRPIDGIQSDTSKTITIIDSFESVVDSELSKYNLSKSDLISVEITKMEWVLDSDCTLKSFEIIKDSIKVYMANYGGNIPPLVAYKDQVQPSGKKLYFDVTKADLKYYFQNEYLQYVIQFKSSPMIGVPAGLTLKTNLEYKINFQRRPLN